MLDLTNLVQNSSANVQVFNANSYNNAVSWHVWNKPRGISMVTIFAIGAGGAGGQGSSNSISSEGAGGGGGASGGQVVATLPVLFIPDILYISVSFGSVYNGNLATSTIVAGYPNTAGTTDYTFIHISRGGSGLNASGATGGGGGAPGSNANVLLGGKLSFSVACQVGTSGGNRGAAGGNLTLPLTGLVVTGGTGGGGLADPGNDGHPGGTINNNGPFPALPGGQGPGLPSHGNDGIKPINSLFYFYGGTGGAGAYNPSGQFPGNGGNGGYGCGGGGAGARTTSSPTPTPGNGGDGLVIISAW